MDSNNNSATMSRPTTIIIQPASSKLDSKSNKLIFRLGWISFIFGACAFMIHYISIDYLRNFSPFNAGIIAGFFLMIAGLSSVAAGYQETSYRSFVYAQIWSFIVNIILAPGLIVVSIAALIIDSEDIRPMCEPTVSSSRVILFGNSLELHASNVPCLKILHRFNLAQILNTVQLVIGLICFFVHVILVSVQRKVLKQLKMTQNDQNKLVICTESRMSDKRKCNEVKMNFLSKKQLYEIHFDNVRCYAP